MSVLPRRGLLWLPAAILLWPTQLPAQAEAGLRIVAPRVGEAMPVGAGGALVIRVQVPTALTPPPGTQQARALSPWRAALVHTARPWPAGSSLTPEQPLEVVDLRPESATSLRYRVSLQLPRWVPPGRYGLRLSGPGGSSSVTDAVRVGPAGETASRYLVAADTGPWRVRGGQPRFYPVGELGPDTPLLALLPAAAEIVGLQPGKAAGAGTLSLHVEPPEPRVDSPVRLWVQGLSEADSVAWRLGFRHTAWGAEPLQHSFRRVGPHTIHALVVRPDGSTRWLTTRLQVHTHVASSCARTFLPANSGAGPWALLLSILLWAKKARFRSRRE